MYMCWPCGVVTGARESNSIKGIRSSSSAVGFSTLLSASVSTFFFLYIYILFSRGCISKGWAYRQPKHQEREKKFLLFLILFFFSFFGGLHNDAGGEENKVSRDPFALWYREEKKEREREGLFRYIIYHRWWVIQSTTLIHSFFFFLSSLPFRLYFFFLAFTIEEKVVWMEARAIIFIYYK